MCSSDLLVPGQFEHPRHLFESGEGLVERPGIDPCPLGFGANSGEPGHELRVAALRARRQRRQYCRETKKPTTDHG